MQSLRAVRRALASALRCCGPVLRPYRALAGLLLLLLSLGAPTAAFGAPATGASEQSMQLLREAELLGGTVLARGAGAPTLVSLPDTAVLQPGAVGPVRREYRLRLHLAALPRDHALYFPGLFAHASIAVNGQVVLDSLLPADRRLPRGVDLVQLLPVPDAFWRLGDNLIEISAAGPRALSISPIEVGARRELVGGYRAKLFGTVIGPGLMAAIIGTLGLCMLLLWSRLREPLHGYFGAGTLCWALHSGWSVMPWALLPGRHYLIWWTSLYPFFVVALVIFSLRFTGWRWPRFERAIGIAALASPAALYAALALGALDQASTLLRLGLVALVLIGVLSFFRAAWRHRSTDNLLMAGTGLVCLVTGAHDWLAATYGDDNNPAYWVPYAGLLFVVIVVRMLVDRLVFAARQLESMNSELERRVDVQHAELRVALDAMRLARDAAEEADRAKTRFLAAASHDLRQPAHALGLYLAALREERLDADQAELVQRMSGSLAALDTMFNALLNLSRIDAGGIVPHVRPFSLAALLRALADEFAPQAEARGLRFALRVPANPASVTGDALLIERILRNLLANAVKYTSRGGILLSCRARSASPGPPAIGQAQPAGHWRVEVWDTGIGIAPAHRERIFEEFFQVGNPGRDRDDGLGLGLSIVGRLVKLLGLGLMLSSRAGRGSRFTLCLPMQALAQAGQAAAVAETAGPSELPHTAERGDLTTPGTAPLLPLTVALVEDDAEVRHAMGVLLRRWGCHVIEGADAGDILRQRHADLPDAVIADFRLAGARSGPAEVQALFTRWRGRVPALIVTGESLPQTLLEIQASGLPWLEKPLAPHRLRSWLEQVARQRAMRHLASRPAAAQRATLPPPPPNEEKFA